MTSPWIVCAWPPVFCQEASAPPLRLVHHGTLVQLAGDPDQPTCGQTLWASVEDDTQAGVAWDWVELREGVYALADPLGLVTNLQFVDSAGSVLGPHATACRLNALVRALPWQAEIRRALHAA
jgi:hypothetical protein